MNMNDFVILPGSKTGTSVRLKAKTVRELQLEKVQLERENREMEEKLQQLQAIMSREKEERKKSSAYRWKSGQAGPMTIQARVFSQSKENNKVREADIRVGKLEVVDRFVKEEPSSESTCTGPENQDKGLLLNDVFNEEESAKSFQEALLQWRKDNCDHREQLHASEVLTESVGISEVQTNLTVMKEPIHVEFKKDGLSYMEKLLLKKYRRTPVDQISGSCIKDLRPVQTPSVHQAVLGQGGEDDDDDVNDLTVEEVKRYWTSVFREEVPDTISESLESTLKIEFLDDSYGKDLEESSNFLVMEAGPMGMNKQGKTEPLKQCGSGSAVVEQSNTVPDFWPRETEDVMRKSSSPLTSAADTQYFSPLPLNGSPVSSQEISQEKMAVCSLGRNSVQKESVNVKALRRSLSSCQLPEKICNPTELRSSRYLLETQLQKTNEDSQELDRVCSSQSLVLPVIAKSSVLQDLAKRQKSASTRYWGLEGFFVVGANPKQVMLEACSSLCAGSDPADRSISFPGAGKWVTERSLSEYADDSLVQGVLESQLNRPSGGLETQNRISPLMVAWQSHSGNDFIRPWSTSMLHCKLTGNCPTNTQPRPKSSPVCTFRVDTEIAKPKYLSVTKQDEYCWEYEAEQEALLTLEKELQSYTGLEKHYSLTSVDVTSSSRHSRKININTTDLHKNLELKDHSRVDTPRGWDESQMDDVEEILEDKQQVLALQ
ncbi:zinc finger B-box domain-containing protein 1 [Athene cunicularia]|uniref:zinc finger B-box domain-containing protein 1 n=1 Tax=Athene cunicularia TaxID=194338 RepID=UPI000EF706E3|nr:zinc finger B-box domain-containing protein 1 [Athene cunicularia]